MGEETLLQKGPSPTKPFLSSPNFQLSALSQGFGYDGGVFLGSGLEAKLGMAAGADEALRPQFEKSCGEHLSVRQLFAHVHMVHPPGKDKGHGLTGKVFNYEVFHEASSAVLAFAPVLQVLAHGLVMVRKVG